MNFGGGRGYRVSKNIKNFPEIEVWGKELGKIKIIFNFNLYRVSQKWGN